MAVRPLGLVLVHRIMGLDVAIGRLDLGLAGRRLLGLAMGNRDMDMVMATRLVVVGIRSQRPVGRGVSGLVSWSRTADTLMIAVGSCAFTQFSPRKYLGKFRHNDPALMMTRGFPRMESRVTSHRQS